MNNTYYEDEFEYHTLRTLGYVRVTCTHIETNFSWSIRSNSYQKSKNLATLVVMDRVDEIRGK